MTSVAETENKKTIAIFLAQASQPVGPNLMCEWEKVKSAFEEDTEVGKLGYTFLVAKSFEVDLHERLKPLAMHLITEGRVQDMDALKLIGLYGYQLEAMQKSMKNVETDLNKTMSDFRFDEKVVISNRPVESMVEVARYAMQMATADMVEQVKEVVRKTGANTEEMTIFQVQPQKKVNMRR
jgi:hypothetical protein